MEWKGSVAKGRFSGLKSGSTVNSLDGHNSPRLRTWRFRLPHFEMPLAWSARVQFGVVLLGAAIVFTAGFGTVSAAAPERVATEKYSAPSAVTDKASSVAAD